LKGFTPRIVATLVGNINQDPEAVTKYGHFFECLSQRVSLIDVHDCTLRGADRLINAFQVFHPNQAIWRERFYKNVPAFRKRSQGVAHYLQSLQEQVDAVLQLGTLFDSNWNNTHVPNIIYTDYTAFLSANKPKTGRSPFSPQQLKQWIDLERQAYQKATYIFSRSKLVRNSIIKNYGIPAQKVGVIGGGVNFATLPQLSTKSSFDKPTALFIGKNFYRKGGDLLLKAFARSREHFPEACLLLLTGDKIPTNLPLVGVEIIAPTSNREVINALYRRADLFVMPSRLETWGDVFLEAMAYGLPCIGTDDDAMSEIIIDQKTGLIVPAESIDGISSALNLLFGNDAFRCQLGIAGRKRVEAKFTWEKIIEQMVPILRKVIGPATNGGTRIYDLPS